MRWGCCRLALTQSRHDLGKRPEMMTVMVMMMVLTEYLYIRCCGMCFTQMVTFDSHNNPRAIDFLFYR